MSWPAPISTTRSASTAGRSNATSPAIFASELSADTPIARLYPVALSHDRADAHRQSVGGRTLRVDDSLRVNPRRVFRGACFVMGEAAGTAADIALKAGVRLRAHRCRHPPEAARSGRGLPGDAVVKALAAEDFRVPIEGAEDVPYRRQRMYSKAAASGRPPFSRQEQCRWNYRGRRSFRNAFTRRLLPTGTAGDRRRTNAAWPASRASGEKVVARKWPPAGVSEGSRGGTAGSAGR